MSFTSYIKKQASRDDPVGDFARDFVYILDNHPAYPECRGTDTIETETLYGHYMFLSSGAKNRDWVVKILSDTWREWLEYKHIGLKFGVPKRGYVYFFNIENEDNIFKIGRTSTSPEERMASVAAKERARVKLFDWMEINYFDIIEKELHSVFQQKQVMREWFKVDKKEIEKAIHVYSLTDDSCIVKTYKEFEGVEDYEDE